MRINSLWITLLCASVVALWGCRSRVAEPAPESPPLIFIQIVMPSDTLRFVPGDSAKTCGFVLVRDGDMHPIAGVPVTFYLEQRNLGFLEFTGPHGDTTDANGCVYFCYRALGHAGHDVILVIYGMQSVRQDIFVQQATVTPPPAGITVIPDTLYLRSWGEELSALVVICPGIEDTAHNGIPGILPPIRASSGRFAAMPGSAQDSLGCSWLHWYSNGEGPGRYWFRIQTDSAFVDIIDSLPKPRMHQSRS